VNGSVYALRKAYKYKYKYTQHCYHSNQTKGAHEHERNGILKNDESIAK
jgi:hypothetical protein